MLESILIQIDAEISRLQAAKAILSTVGVQTKRKPGRPAKVAPIPSLGPTKGKRTLSAQAREKMRQGQLKRWAKAKK